MVSDADQTSRRPWCSFVGAAAVCLLATFVIAWVLIGDISEVPESADPDRMVDAPDLPGAVTVSGALAAALALVVVGVRHVRVGSAHRLRRPSGLVPVVLLGSYLALLARVVTAGTIGANIGGGIMLIFVTPVVVPFLVVATVVMAVRRPASEANGLTRLDASSGGDLTVDG